MLSFDLVKLTGLMSRTAGSPEVLIGLIDGPVATHLPQFANSLIVNAQGVSASCQNLSEAACRHGTLMAEMLAAKQEENISGICSGCRLLVRPVFGEAPREDCAPPSAEPAELADAIVDCVNLGARIINLSL